MTNQVQTTVPAIAVPLARAPRKPLFDTGNIVAYILLSIGALVVMFPFVWMLSSSFKPAGEILEYPPKLLPSTVTIANYRYVLEQTGYLTFVKNSLIVVAFTITGHVVSGSLVAYGFARFRFPGRNILFMLLLGTLMIPFQAYLIPRFFIISRLGLHNTLAAVFLPYLFGGPFYIFLMRQFLMQVPRELDDAAKIDGCNSWQVFWYVLFPLIRPAVATVMVLEFLAAWSSFLEPLIYLTTMENYTVALGLSLFRQGFGGTVDWGALMSATVMTALPPLVVFFFAQKQLIGGISTMGLKG